MKNKEVGVSGEKQSGPGVATILTARFWGEFGRGAQMPFDNDCVIAAWARNYYANVEFNQQMLFSAGGELDEACNCCYRAGVLAAEFAVEAGLKSIGQDQFNRACKDLEKRIQKVRKYKDKNKSKTKKSDQDEQPVGGGVCAV